MEDTMAKQIKTVGVVLAAIISAATLSSAAHANIFKKIGHAVSSAEHSVVKEANKIANDKVVKKIAKTTTNVVSNSFEATAQVAHRVPVINMAEPMFHDAANAVQTKSGKLGALAGAAAGVATGGLSYGVAGVGMAASRGMMTDYYGRKIVATGKNIGKYQKHGD
jgi:hypothetical protein